MSQVKVGDLIKWASGLKGRECVDHGVVLQLSKTGHDSLSAKVLFQDGSVEWLSTNLMEVVSGNR